ncbi:uncharacterized protein LOC123535200 [Mercenaria mercenaria]|uniref:uncharacterized protein LOC123535200 n=1 Tax=Mercenaria mercenaria TaxID=6596 RepID=UPI00234F0456|nr:uncharacterized protein LOC123535200 [Mercenaria mercenaria]
MGNFIWNIQITFVLFYGTDIVQGSVKKGVAIAPKAFLCDDFKALNNVAWWYNWGANIDKIRNYSGCVNVSQHADTHVPMTWGYGHYFSRYYIYDQAEFLLGFNEPNHKAQSNIKPEDAAKYWREVEALADGRPVVSPAAAPCASGCNGDTKEWFDQFFKSCNDCRVDYLATHVYSCNADKTMAFLEGLYKLYNLTIWLTEFACPRKTNPLRQLKYMKEVLPKLEEAPYIFRYAWYVSRVTENTATTFIPMAASLLEPDSSSLTVLGQFYNNFTSTDTSTSTTGSTVNNTTTTTTSSYNTTMYNTTTKSTSDYNSTTASTVYNTTTMSKSYTISTLSKYDNTTMLSTKTTINIYISSAKMICVSVDIIILTTWMFVQQQFY